MPDNLCPYVTRHAVDGELGTAYYRKLCLGDLMKMSIVDTIDLVYSIYAIGVFVFIAYFAYKLTKPKSG